MPTQKRIRWGAWLLWVGILAGCAPGKSAHPVASTKTTTSAPASVTDAPRVLDLTRPLLASYMVGDSMLAPLSFAQQMARSAGGTWIVFASKPLNDVKLSTPEILSGGSHPVKDILEALHKGQTPLTWNTDKGYMLLDFGPEQEFTRLRAQPPTETIGVLLCGENLPTLLGAMGDVWHLKIEASPELLKRRSAIDAARRKVQEEESGATALLTQQMSSYLSRFGQGNESGAKTNMVEFKAVQRLDTEALLQRFAQSMGAEAHNQGGNSWQLLPLSDPQKIQAEVGRLKGSIDQAASTASLASTSFESRQGSQENDVDATPTVIPPLNEEGMVAFDSLGLLGEPAIPTLAAYLDPEKPYLAQPAMQTLGLLGTSGARSALVAFAGKLQSPTKDRMANALRPQLQTTLIHILARDADPETEKLLSDMALNEKVAAPARTAARMALARTGDLTPFTMAPGKEMAPGEWDFLLRYPAENTGLQPMQTEQDPRMITPLATTHARNGDAWAVFVSDRLGDPNDLWLARGQNHKWVEFLFTGQTYTVGQNASRRGFGNPSSPKPGSCVLEVTDDKVVIRPPDVSQAAELARLQKEMQNSKLGVEQRQKVYAQYSRLAQRAANVMEKPIPLTLTDLRKDTDQDGLPDLVETRLGLDPHKADTDGDGVPDGKDSNPLSGPESARTDRGRILQAIFTALYGADTSPSPIVVVLNKTEWQEFYGTRGRVLCMTPEDFLKSARHLSGLRILQFGGPHDSGATILAKDGPCLFNETHSKAEVHFWQWQPPSSRNQGRMAQLMGSAADNLPTDTIALFEHAGDWKLTTLKPCRLDTADRASAAFIRAMASDVYSGIEF